MLRSVKAFTGYKIQGKDGDVGKLHDLLFEDNTWIVRYIVVDTGKWLPGRKILISPASVEEPDWKKSVIPVNLTVDQIEKSPEISEHEPVSRQNELDIIKYYNWPMYWDIGSAHVPEMNYLAAQELVLQEKKEKEESGQESDPHLRSTHEIMGYKIQALNDDIGHVEDFIAEDESWIIRYLIVDTRDWLPGGKKVLISPAWIREIDWAFSQVKVDLSKEKIENSPEYDSSMPINREYEIQIYDFYGRPKYWD